MQVKSIYYSLLLCLLISVSAIAEEKQSISIAIISDKVSGLDKSPLMSLLEVELSQKEGIQLLERAAIDKILEEQQLSAAGLVDRAAAIKIGKLLRANAFIILSLESQTQDANDLIRVRVSETAHGLRLLDYFEQSNSENPQEAVERIVKKIETVINKINQPDEKLIPLGIVDIHRVQLGEQYKMLERTLPVMLSVRLSLEPHIIMLEREDLKVLLDEKLRTEGEDTKFLNSAVLIEGYLQPNNGGLIMTLSLRCPGGDGTKSFTVPLEPNEPSAAAAKASIEITKQLQDTPSIVQWQPEQEAKEFYEQGQMLKMHSRYDEALSLFETAHALQPQNINYTGTLFNGIWKKHQEIEDIKRNNEEILQQISKSKDTRKIESLSKSLIEIPVSKYTDLEITEMVSVFVRQIRDSYEKGFLSASEIFHNWSQDLGCSIMDTGYSFFSSSLSVSTERIRHINRENRKIWIETCSDTLKKQELSPYKATWRIGGMSNLVIARLTWISSDDPNELIDNLKESFTKYVMPPELGGEISSDLEREELYQKAFTIYNHFALAPEYLNRYTHLKGSGEIFAKLWREYLEEVAPLINPLASTNDLIYNSQDFQTNLENVRKKLQNPTQDSNKHAYATLLRLLSDSMSQSATRKLSIDEVLDIWEELCGYLIDNNDISNLCSIFINDIHTGIFKMIDSSLKTNKKSTFQMRGEFYKRFYLFLNRIFKVLQPHENENQVKMALNNIRKVQVEYETEYPALPAKTELKLTITKLLTSEDWLTHTSLSNKTGQIQGEMLWIATVPAGNQNHRVSEGNIYYPLEIGLAGINLKQKRTTSLWRTRIYPSNNLNKISGLIITDTASYIFLKNIGILEFPGGQTKGTAFFMDSNTVPKEEKKFNQIQRTINNIKTEGYNKQETVKTERKLNLYTKQNGLPSVLFTAIAREEQKFWIAYGGYGHESGLGLYDPNTEQWETVFCSTLKNGSPFSNGQPYQLSSLIYVAPNKLFFTVLGNVQTGLWKLDIVTNETKYLQPISGTLVEDLDGNLQLQSSNYLCKIDPVTEKITLNIRPALNLTGRYLHNTGTEDGLEEEMFLPESFLENIRFGPYPVRGYLDFSTGTIHDNKLWARLGETKILIVEKGKSFEEARIIDNNIFDGNPVERFVGTPYGLIGINDMTVGLIETGD